MSFSKIDCRPVNEANVSKGEFGRDLAASPGGSGIPALMLLVDDAPDFTQKISAYNYLVGSAILLLLVTIGPHPLLPLVLGDLLPFSLLPTRHQESVLPLLCLIEFMNEVK